MDANLSGNWLLEGTLPFTGFGGTPANGTFGVAGSFNIVGNNVEAALAENYVCGGVPASNTIAVIAGTIAADGSFSMQTVTPVQGLPTATLTGSVPASGASSWNGHLTLSNPGSPCPSVQLVDFTAAPIGNVGGTYSGAATVGRLGTTVVQNATFGFAVQQGANLPGSTAFDSMLLSGTVSVQGLSCFSSGTIAAESGSGVLGSEFVVTATMNDGSNAAFLGQILDNAAQHLSVSLVSVSGGACSTFFSSPFTVARQ